MIIFVSGASGYLGSQLVKVLSNEHQVFALMRRTSSQKRIEGVDCEVVYIDEGSVLENNFALHKPEVVINTAALYGRKGESLSELVNANIDFPVQLLTLAEKYNSKAFVHTGTSLPDSISPYALTKNTFVKLANFNISTSVKFINVDLEHFYGPNDDNSKFTTYVINTCIVGDKLALTEGLQERDFIYIDDVIDGYIAILKNIDELDSFETVAIGSGVAITVRELVEMVHTFSHSKSTLDFGALAMRDNELMYSCADTSRLNKLGWNCKTTLECGIKKIVSSYDS